MVIIETSIFTRRVLELLTDDEYRYAKNERDDLSPAQLKILQQIVRDEYP